MQNKKRKAIKKKRKALKLISFNKIKNFLILKLRQLTISTLVSFKFIDPELLELETEKGIRISNGLKSREKYAIQVSKIVKKYHSLNEESFIFGLSGKWGSGKTTFLNLLEEELKKGNVKERFTVLRISPWKFGAEKTTFLRNFLKKLNAKADKEFYEKMPTWELIKRSISQKSFLENLEKDISKPSITINLWSSATIVIVFIWILYKSLVAFNIVSWEFVIFLNANRSFQVIEFAISCLITLFALPIILGFFSINTENRQVVALDQFDKLYKKILGKFKTERLIIFVDDLDRVDPEIARNVLDTLRTFFDKPEVSFIVTGDHSVLERHIGGQIHLTGTDAEKREEGRRYLKKVFNVYWPLPIPTEQEFKTLLNSVLEDHDQEIVNIFGSEKEKQLPILKSWLTGYFDKNFRNIIRFLEGIIFNFGLVNAQFESADAELKKYLRDVIDNPMLFIRILMIQEMAAPLYEEYQKDPSIVETIEEDLITNINDVLNVQIKSLNDAKALSPQQEKFLRKFMNEQPRFYDEKRGITVYIEPFIYLASSSEFVDAKGLTPRDFVRHIDNGNEESVIGSLDIAGVKKLKDFETKLLQKLESELASDGATFVKNLNLILSALSKTKNALSHKHFLKLFSELDLGNFLQTRTSELRKSIAVGFSKWLDTLSEENDLTDFYSKLMLTSQSQIDQIDPYIQEYTEFGGFSSRLLCKWLVYIYQNNPTRAIELAESILDKVKIESLDEFLLIKESLASELAVQPDTEFGKRIWRLAKKINNAEFSLTIGEKLSEQIRNARANTTNWVGSEIEELTKLLSREKLRGATLELIKPSIGSPEGFANSITNHQAISRVFSADIWQELLALDDEAFLIMLTAIAVRPGLSATILPLEKDALIIAGRIMNLSTKYLGDEQKEAGTLRILNKSTLWPWLTLPSTIRKRLNPKIRENAKKQTVKGVVEEIFETWK